MGCGELCQSGTEITTADECRHALEYASLLNITLGHRKTLVGPDNWGWVPYQCSYQAVGDQAFHFNKKESDNGLDIYRMICRKGNIICLSDIF